MPAPAELSLSTTFKRAQRALDQWLEPGPAHEAAFGLRVLLQAMHTEEAAQLRRWLRWRSYAAHANGNSTLLMRIDKLQCTFGAALGANTGRALDSRGVGSMQAAQRLAHSA